MTKRRFTKILATLGPASDTAARLGTMLDAGLDGARLNMSHGSYNDHSRRVRLLRREARKRGRPIAVVLDLQGPKIRTAGSFPNGELELATGSRVVLTSRAAAGTPERLSVGLRGFAQQVRAGQRVLIDDGKLRLRARQIRGDEVVCDVELGGRIRERRGINLPDTRLALPALTAKDRRDLDFGMGLGVDYVALSFVGGAEDVQMLRRALAQRDFEAVIIAKIERAQALENLDAILEAADGVMVARGDLGVEIPIEEVPAAQKRIVSRAGELARHCITATQMLETMIHAAQPTRAEVSDVANAVFDGTDAVMLSGETAVGRDPAAAIEMMARIVRAAETPLRRTPWRLVVPARRLFRGVLARAAAVAARETSARALVTLTMSGRTALRASKERPGVPIIAVTSRAATWRRAALYWGVVPIQHAFVRSSDRLRLSVERALVRAGHLAPGDTVAYLGGVQPGPVVNDFLQLRQVEVSVSGTTTAQRRRRSSVRRRRSRPFGQ